MRLHRLHVDDQVGEIARTHASSAQVTLLARHLDELVFSVEDDLLSAAHWQVYFNRWLLCLDGGLILVKSFAH